MGEPDPMDSKRTTGGCLCGAVRYEATGEPVSSGMCHCRMCQRWSGGPSAGGIRFPLARFRFTRGEPKRHLASPIFERSFCAECGGHVCMRYLVPPYGPDTTLVLIGSLDEPHSAPGPKSHFGVESHLPAWYTLQEGTARRPADGDPGLAQARAAAGMPSADRVG